jgi:hypothetical protein
MLRHALPSADDETILDRALTALLTELARRKFGAEPSRRAAASDCLGAKGDGAKEASPDEPAEPHGATIQDSRHVPVDVKRAVWVRDLGRCAFVGPEGHRCGERAFLEFHHLRPHAVGGKPTVENIQLRCRRHNAYEARVFFAREAVDEPEVFRHAPASAEASSRPRSARVLAVEEPSSIGRTGRHGMERRVVPERVATITIPSRGPAASI